MTRAIFAIIIALSIGASSQASAQSKLTEAQAEKGKPIYEKLCVGCHGITGEGDGPAADRLRPRPRNFRGSRFKFTWTNFGKLPQDETLFKWIAEGLNFPATSMPGWSDVLSDEEIWSVVAYIKTFSKKFKRDEKKKRYPKPITIGEAPQWTEADISAGKELFLKNCEKCHGTEGRGSGATAVALKHDFGDRIWPRNLTKGWTYRAGNAPADIYRTIATGISGTPMPAHADALKPEQIWDIVGFVDSIVDREPPKVQEVILSKFVSGDLPADPNDEAWAAIAPGYIPLVSQIIEGERWFTTTLESVEARSMYNDENIAILVEWDDHSQSPLPAPNSMFPVNEPDALAIQFPTEIPAGMEKPYFLGGSEEKPVILWKWVNGKGAVVQLSKGIMKQDDMPEGNQLISVNTVYDNGKWKSLVRPKPGGAGR